MFCSLPPCCFFHVFLDVSFSPPWPPRSAGSGRKGAKMRSKTMEKVVRRRLAAHAKSMAGTVWEAHGEVPGRYLDPLFSGTRCEGLPRGSRGGCGTICCAFWCPLGDPWGLHFHILGLFLQLDFQVRFWSCGALWCGCGAAHCKIGIGNLKDCRTTIVVVIGGWWQGGGVVLDAFGLTLGVL